MLEVQRLMKENQKVGNFGIKYLDDFLQGILKSDLILLGARSGAGKSTIANMIAQANKNTKITLFSLENFKGDDLLALTYKYYKELTGNYSLMQRGFSSGQYKLSEGILTQAQDKAYKELEHINLITRTKNYGLKKLRDDMIEAVTKKGTELIIIDHLDYVDKDNTTDNDVSHVTELMKTIRGLQDQYKVAVVAISHLRKHQGKEPPAVPSMDEFIGSSNKVKQATAVIMLAPDDKQNEQTANDTPHIKSTWCCVRKLRNGILENKTARLYFNTHKTEYDKHYDKHIVSYSGEIKNG